MLWLLWDNCGIFLLNPEMGTLIDNNEASNLLNGKAWHPSVEFVPPEWSLDSQEMLIESMGQR